MTASASTFGVDTVVRATSDRWVRHLAPEDKADIVIEAVGHQVATLGHAIEAAAFGGTMFYFGVTDDDTYPISIRTMLRNNLTLKSGVTLDRRRVLDKADAFAREHPDLLHALSDAHVRHRRGAVGVRGGVPSDAGRVKIAIVRMTTASRLQDALAAEASRSSVAGWSVLTIIGPEVFAKTGYDYVGFDCQHGYLDDADVAWMLHRLEHVPIATAVRLPSAASRAHRPGARCRSRRDHRRHDRVRRAGRRGGRRDAIRAGACAASVRCEPAWDDVAALESRVSVYAMVETATGLRAIDEICAVPGLAGIYVGPADLAISMGHGLADAWTASGRARRHDADRVHRGRGGSGHRRPRGRRGDWESRRRTRISRDHPGIGVTGATQGRSRHTSREGAETMPHRRKNRQRTEGTPERPKPDRVALVTGAARGQGAAIVKRLRSDGFLSPPAT